MLTARTYSAVDEVEIDGVKFQITAIPAGQWRALMLKRAGLVRAAKRRFLLDFLTTAKTGGNAAPSDEEVRDGILADPVFHDDLDAFHMEMAVWGVRGHAGFKFDDGRDVPFESKELEYLGRKFLGASDATVILYQDVQGLLGDLANALEAKNGLDAQKKRASPPSSSLEEEGSAAAAASKPPTSPP